MLKEKIQINRYKKLRNFLFRYKFLKQIKNKKVENTFVIVRLFVTQDISTEITCVVYTKYLNF